MFYGYTTLSTVMFEGSCSTGTLLSSCFMVVQVELWFRSEHQLSNFGPGFWQEMREHFLSPETVSWNAALCAYEQAGRWEDALELLRDMRKLRSKL